MSFQIDDDGSLVWINEKGQWHREKGPALIYPNGTIEYRFNDSFHRLNGPAEIYPNGRKYYWIHGKHYTKENYLTKVRAKVTKL